MLFPHPVPPHPLMVHVFVEFGPALPYTLLHVLTHAFTQETGTYCRHVVKLHGYWGAEQGLERGHFGP